MNFELSSTVAEQVELVLVDESLGKETDRIEMKWMPGHRFIAEVEGVSPGQHYGFRVTGPYDPEHNLFCDPSKVLLDPYAHEVAGELDYSAKDRWSVINPDTPNEPLGLDSLGYVPLSRVSPLDDFDWKKDSSFRRPTDDLIIYEAHVKGATALHPKIEKDLRGTYLGISSDPFIDHIQKQGITAVELLPIFHFLDEPEIRERGLSNFWGYNTLSFFAPTNRYGASVEMPLDHQVKEMVRRLHEAGIEVLLDVVFNHTAEGGWGGPTLCYRGIDNRAYYLCMDPGPDYINWSGTGNTLNLNSSLGLDLVLRSLRYWVEAFHVDGFRFDLASAISQRVTGGEYLHESPYLATLYRAMIQDPVLSQVRLITESWDATMEGQMLGAFPHPFQEWNGQFRDDVRRFWNGDRTAFGAYASALAGSEHLFGPAGRGSNSSVNFVACHDGFTLSDLLTYREKNNMVNGWDNTDGSNSEVLVELVSVSEELDINFETLRRRAALSMLASVTLAKGVPMILYGDEYLRSQEGNNNGYCQDNEITYTSYGDQDDDLTEELGILNRLRRQLQIFGNESFFRPRQSDPSGPFDSCVDEIEFYKDDGGLFDEQQWQDSPSPSLTVVLSTSPGDKNSAVAVIVVNPSGIDTEVKLPQVKGVETMKAAFDAASILRQGDEVSLDSPLAIPAKSLVVLLSGGPNQD